MSVIDHKINDHRGSLSKQVGFVANPNLSLWENIKRQLGTMNVAEFLARPWNAACHNLLRNNNISAGTAQLLGLGLNYCVKPATIEITEATFQSPARDIRRMYALRDVNDGGN